MIKYECDNCKKLVNAADAYGPGVGNQGRALDWVLADPDSNLVIGVLPHRKDESHHALVGEYCGECVGKALVELVHTLFPMMLLTVETVVAAGQAIEAKYVEFEKEVLHGQQDDSRGDSPDSDVREVRTEPEVPESGAHEPQDWVRYKHEIPTACICGWVESGPGRWTRSVPSPGCIVHRGR